MAQEVEVDLGYQPREWQTDCHLAKRKHSVLVVHRQAGKTELALQELVAGAIRCGSKDGRFAYIAPQLKQARRVAWDRLKMLVAAIPGKEIREVDGYVELPNAAGGRSRISVYGADEPDSLRGIYLDGAVLDELAQMKPDTWESVVSIALMTRNGWVIFIGTVKGVDMLSELYHKTLRGDLGDDWSCKLYTVYDTGVFTPEQIAEKKRTMSDAAFRREFLCDFTVAAENQLISLELVETAARRNPPEDVWRNSPKVLGVDVSRSESGDRSVIFPRQGLLAHQPMVFRGISNMRLASEVANKAQTWGADHIFVDSGRGEGVIDRLRQLGFSVTPVVFGGKPIQAQYLNKRMEMWDTARQWLEDGGTLPNRESLKLDLCGPTYSYQQGSDKMKLESKDDMKKRGLPSPDEGDALICTFAFPVASKSAPTDPFAYASRPKVKTDSNPLDTMLGRVADGV